MLSKDCNIKDCTQKSFEQEDKCILHCKKNERNGWYKLDEKKDKEWDLEKLKLFWEALRSLIDKQKNGGLSKFLPIGFEKIIFPKLEGTNGLAIDGTNSQNSFFKKDDKPQFTQSVQFDKCTFLDNLYLEDIHFEKDVNFSDCTFQNKIKLKKIQTGRVSFLEGCKIRNLDLSQITFKQKVEIKNCYIYQCNLENTQFNKVCDFTETHFKKTNFNETTFEDIAVFEQSTFDLKTNFQYTTFKKLVFFKKTTFKETVNFADSIFKEEANFLNITTNVANRETARIIKNGFEQQNNIIEANKFYALEMKEREKELNKDFFNIKREC